MSKATQTTVLKEKKASVPQVLDQTHFAPHAPVFRSSFRYFRQTVLTGLPLVIADIFAIGIAVFTFYGIVSLFPASITLSPLLVALQVSGTFVIIAIVQRSYPGCGTSPVIELKNSVIATFAAFILFIPNNWLLLGSIANSSILLGSFPLALAIVPLFKSFVRSQCAKCRWWGYPAVVFASNDGESLFQQLAGNRRMGVRPVGIIGPPHSVWHEQLDESDEYLGSDEETARIADQHNAYWAVISSNDTGADTEGEQSNLEAKLGYFPRVLVLSQASESPSLWNQSLDVNGTPGVLNESRLMLPSSMLFQRVSNILMSLLLSIFCLPIIAILALAVKWTSPGPAFYAHRRLGRGGKSFRAWKLRTMHIDADQLLAKHLASDVRHQQEWDATQKLKSDPRVTRIGQLLRATSLDELPQIWNVLRGEMSLVGPRPIVDEEISKYRHYYQLYSKVTPGITGLWQISGRNHTTYEERVAYDAYYVRNWSPWLDFYILTRTIKVVLTREGAY